MSGPWYKPSLREVRPGHEPTSPHPAWGRRPPQMQKHAAGGLCALPPAATTVTLSKAQVQSPRVGTRPRSSAECGTFPQTWTPPSPSLLRRKRKEWPQPPRESPTVCTHPSALHGATRVSRRGDRHQGLPHEGTASSSLDGQRTRELQALPAWPEQRAWGPPRTPSPPACQDSDHVHRGEGGSRGQRSNSRHSEGPRPHGRACTRTARGAELDLRQDWRPGRPGVAGAPPPKWKVTRAGAAALTFCSCLGYS